jgi:hypothetical protein
MVENGLGKKSGFRYAEVGTNDDIKSVKHILGNPV